MLHVVSVLHFPLTSLAGTAARQSIATTTDDLENREINAAGIHGVHPKWAYGGGAGRGVEGSF